MQIIRDIPQGSEEWIALRKGVITGTRLKQVMGKKDTRFGLICELIADLIAPSEDKFVSSAMERGSLLEGIIKEKFPEYEEVTFIKKNDWIGLSPDGVEFETLVDEAGNREQNIIGAIEIKSPGAKNFVAYKIANEIPSEYIWQVVQYFIVIHTLQYLDFVVFNPEICDENLRYFTIRVTREQLADKIVEAQEALWKFKEEWDEAKKAFLK